VFELGRQNCWEFKDCGRESGGHSVASLGVCPAASNAIADGIHGGRNGGRACWGIVGTYCAGEVQDSLAAKLHRCVGCDFRTHVIAEEGEILGSLEIAQRLGL
jgi:hypothetical protein